MQKKQIDCAMRCDGVDDDRNRQLFRLGLHLFIYKEKMCQSLMNYGRLNRREQMLII